MARKTRRGLPVTRRLDQLGTEYAVIEFDPSVRSAAGVAEATGLDPDRVLKTLVVTGPGERSPILVMLPADRTLDLKLLAAEHDVRKLYMASHADAERLTGLKVGGISALALMDKRWPVYLDASAATFDSVLVSAGARGFDIRIATADLVRLTGARIGSLSRADG